MHRSLTGSGVQIGLWPCWKNGHVLDPDDLEVALRVIRASESLPAEHPDAVAIRRATAGIFKSVKQQRRSERRREVLTADRAVIAATATGAPNRIDDETRGAELVVGDGSAQRPEC